MAKLSLFTAILININIMLGSGLFINTVLLSKQAGSLSALSYAIVGLLLFPLILGMSQLLKCNLRGGTFYHFGEAISPAMGFLASWSYFTAKLGSFTLAIHVCNSLLQQIIPILNNIPILALDSSIILAFMGLNMLKLNMGKSIQYVFISLKLIPILFAIFSGLYLFSGNNFINSTIISGVPVSIPFVLFAFIGFEASCSISNSLENPKDGAKAILISYLFVVTIVILYQLMFWASLGWSLAKLNSFLEAFPVLINKFDFNITLNKTILALMNIGIASSALGASYGMMFTNGWNLFTLAENKHIFLSNYFTKFNKHNIPYFCIIAQAIISLIYLLISNGNQVPLQQLGAFGSTIAYSISSIALLFIYYKSKIKVVLPTLSIASCTVLVGSFLWNINSQGVTFLFIFYLALLAFGILMFLATKTKN